MVKQTLLDRLIWSKDWHPLFGPGDPIVSGETAHQDDYDRFLPMLEQSVKFDITNVANYVWDNRILQEHYPSFLTGGEHSVDKDPEHFVCTPSYSMMFMEFESRPNAITSHADTNERITQVSPPMRTGWLLVTMDLQAHLGECGTKERDLTMRLLEEVGNPVHEDCRWFVYGTEWSYQKYVRVGDSIRKAKFLMGPSFQACLQVGKDGRLLRRDFSPYFNRDSWEGKCPILDSSDWSDCFSRWIPVQYGLTFLNCRNVTQEIVTPSPKATKAHRKRTGKELFEYRNLVIDAVKPEGSSRSISNGGMGELAARRLHVCRGHFRVYTEDKPLFGHYVGPVWIAAHERGEEKEGVIAKDYEVRT